MSALTPKADIQGLAQNYIFRIWPDVRFLGQSRRKLGCGKMSAYSHKRTFRFNAAVHAVGCGIIAPPKAVMENLGVYKFTIS